MTTGLHGALAVPATGACTVSFDCDGRAPAETIQRASLTPRLDQVHWLLSAVQQAGTMAHPQVIGLVPDRQAISWEAAQ